MLAAVAAVSCGEAILAKGMRQPTPAGGLFTQFRAVATNPHVIVGTMLMTTYFGIYMYCLRIAPLNFVLPMSAVSYLLGAGLAKWYLGEQVSSITWAGTLVITLGVIIVGLGGSVSSHSP